MIPPHCPVLSDAAVRDIQQRNRDHPGWVLSPEDAEALLLEDAERMNQKEKR